jgi:hypothetical protein
MELSKQFAKVVCVLLLVVVTQQDYFAGLQLDPALSKSANAAMNDFKNSLDNYLDCGGPDSSSNGKKPDPSPPSNPLSFLHNIFSPPRRLQGRHHRGIFGMQTQWGKFSKNKDSNAFAFSFPVPKITDSKRIPSINQDLYDKAKKVAEQLAKIKACLIQYNNVIVGSNNSVNGNSNVVIGSNNIVGGSNQWVFDSDFKVQGV